MHSKLAVYLLAAGLAPRGGLTRAAVAPAAMNRPRRESSSSPASPLTRESWLFKFLCAGPQSLLQSEQSTHSFLPQWASPASAPVDVDAPTEREDEKEEVVERNNARFSLSIDGDSAQAEDMIWAHDEKELAKVWGSLEREIIEDRTVLNDAFVFAWVAVVVIPIMCMLMSCALSVPLNYRSHEEFGHTFMWMMSNLAGLPKSRSGWRPDTLARRVIAMATTVVGYVLIAAITGLASQLPLVGRAVHQINQCADHLQLATTIVPHVVGTSLYVLIFPVGANAVLLKLMGGATNAMTFRQAYFYMFSAVIGLTDPLTEVHPHTFAEEFAACFGSFSNLGVAGAIIGIVAELTAVRKSMKAVTKVAADRILAAENKSLQLIEERRIRERHLDVAGKHTLAESVYLKENAAPLKALSSDYMEDGETEEHKEPQPAEPRSEYEPGVPNRDRVDSYDSP